MPDVYKEALSKETPAQTPVAPYAIPCCLSCSRTLLIFTELQPLLLEEDFLPLSSITREIGNLLVKRVKSHMETMLMDLGRKYSSLRIPTLTMLPSKKQKQPF